MSENFDLLLKGGELVDPGQGQRGVRDVAFRDGLVAAVAEQISEDQAKQTLDVSGKLVTPGLIDIHGHYFEHIVPFATQADAVCLPNGVTTTVDAGSSGWTHFDGFKEYIIKREKTRIMALINLSALGMLSGSRAGGFGPHGGHQRRTPDSSFSGLCRGADGPPFRTGGRDDAMYKGQPQCRAGRKDSPGRCH